MRFVHLTILILDSLATVLAAVLVAAVLNTVDMPVLDILDTVASFVFP